MAVQTFSVKSKGNLKITDNFKVGEFRCKDGSDIVLIDVDFVKDKLQKIREWAGKPVSITSGYRTETYNRKVGGASRSYHVKGQAFDIVVQGKTLDEVCRYAESIGILGIIKYPNKGFVHVDSRTTKYFSDNSDKSACATFGGNGLHEVVENNSKPSYSVGKKYVLKTELKVRTSPGTDSSALKHGELTPGGQSADLDKDGALDKGTVVTCQEIQTVGDDIWIKCPSGWLAAYYQGKVYIGAL